MDFLAPFADTPRPLRNGLKIKTNYAKRAKHPQSYAKKSGRAKSQIGTALPQVMTRSQLWFHPFLR